MNEQNNQIDWQRAARQMNEGMAVFTAQLHDFFQRVGKALQPTFEAYLKLAQDIHDALHTAYLEDGAIYGDTHEGLMRWLEECGKINRLRAEAERLEQYHEGMRQFKQRLIESREHKTE